MERSGLSLRIPASQASKSARRSARAIIGPSSNSGVGKAAALGATGAHLSGERGAASAFARRHPMSATRTKSAAADSCLTRPLLSGPATSSSSFDFPHALAERLHTKALYGLF